MHNIRKLKDENGKEVFVVAEDSSPDRLVFRILFDSEQEAIRVCEHPEEAELGRYDRRYNRYNPRPKDKKAQPLNRHV